MEDTSKFDLQLQEKKKESEIPKKEKNVAKEETFVKQKKPNFLSLVPHVRSFWVARGLKISVL